MNEKRYFCIRGFMKSGTNWLERLVNRHPQVSSTGEFHWQEILQPLLNRGNTTSLFRNKKFFLQTVEMLRDVFRKSIELANAPQATWVGDRTPHSLDPLILPEAHHISIIRDGRDVLVSRVFHLFNNPGVTRVFERSPELAEMLQGFKSDPWFFHKSPELLLSSEELVRISARWWREHLESDRETVVSNPDLKVMFIKYERMHLETELVSNEIFGFLEVDPGLAEPITGDAAPGFEEERPDKFQRKGIVGDWKNYFTDSSRAWFQEEAGEELVRQGYAENGVAW